MTLTIGATPPTVREPAADAAASSVLAGSVAATVCVPTLRLAVGAIAVQVIGELVPVQVADNIAPPSKLKPSVPVGVEGPVKATRACKVASVAP